jgi:hypothetical protein
MSNEGFSSAQNPPIKPKPMMNFGGKQFLRLTGMYYQKLKNSLSIIRKTPFHPQWFAYLHQTSFFRSIGGQAQGVILDIGCADQTIKHYITRNQGYIGLDYYQTATQWYKTKPMFMQMPKTCYLRIIVSIRYYFSLLWSICHFPIGRLDR